jgi:hypothetical protein
MSALPVNHHDVALRARLAANDAVRPELATCLIIEASDEQHAPWYVTLRRSHTVMLFLRCWLVGDLVTLHEVLSAALSQYGDLEGVLPIAGRVESGEQALQLTAAFGSRIVVQVAPPRAIEQPVLGAAAVFAEAVLEDLARPGYLEQLDCRQFDRLRDRAMAAVTVMQTWRLCWGEVCPLVVRIEVTDDLPWGEERMIYILPVDQPWPSQIEPLRSLVATLRHGSAVEITVKRPDQEIVITPAYQRSKEHESAGSSPDRR